MARSVHTRPRHLRAARRVRAPYATRGVGDSRLGRTVAGALKQLGVIAEQEVPSDGLGGPLPLPRLREQRPARGFFHPAEKGDVARVLRFFGAECVYGLRSIELVRGSSAAATDRLQLGRLELPGRIRLYQQRRSPWLLTGALSEVEQARLRRAGAVIEVLGLGSQTLITWPSETLRAFMLFDVLMHEVGHHLVQQYKGKREMRVVRTSEHEAFADLFAWQCRVAYEARASART